MNTKQLLLLILFSTALATMHAMEKSTTTQQKTLTQGILIAIEGIDGSGKTTLAQSLHNMLKQEGFDTILTREPGDTALGKQIREIVQTQTMPISHKAEFLLFAADRAQHFSTVIIPALNNKNLIISDRLADSSLAYQGYGRGLDLATLKTINQWAMKETTPDMTIFIRVPVLTALERCKKRASLSAFEQEKFLEKTAQGFETLYKNCDPEKVIIVDGTLRPNQVTQQVYDALFIRRLMTLYY